MPRPVPVALIALATLCGGVGGCAHLWPPWPFAGGDDWEIGRTARLTAYSSAGFSPPTLEALATLEQSYAVLESALFPGRELAPVDVMLLDWPDFQGALGLRRTGAAIAQLPGKGLYAHRGLIVMHAEDATTAGALHRLTHLFLHGLAPRAPLWVHEGLASYAEAATLRTDDKDPIACLGQLPKKQEEIALTDLFSWSWAEFDESGKWSAYRFTAASLVDYFMMGEGGKLRGKFLDLVAQLQDAASAEATIMKVYPTLSARTLRENVREHRRASEAAPRARCPIGSPVKAETFADSAKPTSEPASEDDMQALWLRLRMLPRRAGQVDWYPPDVIGMDGGQFPQPAATP